jgi:hypothetical protein
MTRRQLARYVKLPTLVQQRARVTKTRRQSVRHARIQIRVHQLEVVMKMSARQLAVALTRLQIARHAKLPTHVQPRARVTKMKHQSAHLVQRVMTFTRQSLDYRAKKFPVITMMIQLAQCQRTPPKSL